MDRRCSLCPRGCEADRGAGQVGVCGQSNDIKIARAALHMWEEPCISGNRGSGTVFFSGCNLRCVYCQNHDISAEGFGLTITEERLTEIFFELKEKGAQNINLVTPTHFVPEIRRALLKAKEQGLDLPIVYNCGGYESVESLKSLNGLVDIYLPDFKYMDEQRGLKYSKVADYPKRAMEALSEMHRQVPVPLFAEDGMMRRGVIVRHLLLPGGLADSKAVVRYLYETYGDSVYISLMSQYTPMPHICENGDFPELAHLVKAMHYNRLVDYALNMGVVNAFIQEGESASESFIPPFTLEGVIHEK